MNPVAAEPIPGRQARPSLLPGDATSFLTALWSNGDVREARVLGRRGVEASGYFDDPGQLVEAVAQRDGKANIYVTLNPVEPTLLDRAANSLILRPSKTTADNDVARRSWLFIDIDSAHPSGVSATEAELKDAKIVLDRLTEALKEEGWPEPITCLSGNGYYALYRIDLPNTQEAKHLTEQVLASFARRFNTPGAHIDTNVANASRLVGLVGTVKMKGTCTEERPHRRSQILALPDGLVPVPSTLLERSAGGLAKKVTVVRNDTDSLSKLLDEAGIDYREQRADAQDIVWYQIRTCPFHGPDHPFECGVGQATDGHYTGKCFHDQSKGWREWKQALGLGARPTPSRVGDGGRQEAAASQRIYARTDAGNAEFFCELFQNELRYDHRRQSWLIWSGHRWRYDKDGAVYRHAIKAARARYHQAVDIKEIGARQQEAKFAISTEDRHRSEAMLKAARCLPPIATTGEQWDQDPWVMGVANGVVDLRTGQLRPGRPEENITLGTDVPHHPESECPRWQRFLREVFVEDADLIEYVHRAAGYSLTGMTIEQCLFMLHGTGANGKSLFLSVLRALLGSYAYNTPFSTFELTRRSDITNDIAPLAGKRLVTSSETNEGARLNEARARAITGCDPLTARFLYEENFTFRPVAKFFLAVNHLPVVTDDSYGFWRRVHLVPFTRQFTTDADPRLEEKLLEELQGILAWAVEGCRLWQERGLDPPASVTQATADYKEKSDVLGEFIAESLLPGETRSIGAAEAYGAYQSWARAQGMGDREMLTATAFGIKMRERFPGKKSKQGKRYLGVGLPGEPVQEVMA